MDIKQIDKKIIKHLFLDGRMTEKELGKKVLASQEVVNYRIKRLLSLGIIKKFIPVVDYSVLGYTIYRVQLKFRRKDKEEWKEFFSSIKETSWLVELSGYYDLVVLFWIRGNNEFFEIIDKINKKFGPEITDMVFTIVNTIYQFPPNFIIQKKTLKEEADYYKIGPFKSEAVKIDEAEEKILKELLINARVPVLEISRKIGYSPTNISYHIKKLIEKKIVIGFMPIIDHTKLGLTHFKITITLQNPSQKNMLKSLLMRSNNLIYVTESYGKYDLEFEYVSEKIEQLFSYLDDLANETPFKNYEIIFNNKEILVNETPFDLK